MQKEGVIDTFVQGSVPRDAITRLSELDHYIEVETQHRFIHACDLPGATNIADLLKTMRERHGEETRIFVLGGRDLRAPATYCVVAKQTRCTTKRTTGARLTWLTQLGMSAESHRLFVLPAIADIQFEYGELRADQPIRAWCVLIRGYASVLPGWLYGLVARAIKWAFSA